jgi:hypothetical protein
MPTNVIEAEFADATVLCFRQLQFRGRTLKCKDGGRRAQLLLRFLRSHRIFRGRTFRRNDSRVGLRVRDAIRNASPKSLMQTQGQVGT